MVTYITGGLLITGAEAATTPLLGVDGGGPEGGMFGGLMRWGGGGGGLIPAGGGPDRCKEMILTLFSFYKTSFRVAIQSLYNKDCIH